MSLHPLRSGSSGGYHSRTQIGTRLGHYEVLSQLGVGGMGEVYLARDTRLGRDVAIKVVSADRTNNPAAQRRFEQEARAIAALSHPNILSLHHFDHHEGVNFFVTELLVGETLANRIAHSKQIPWRDACRIAAAVSEGLAAAHEKGIVHRDLKPSNIFLTSDGQVKILDFGLAQVRSGGETGDRTDVKTETSPGTVLGTIGYMSPEQLRGDAVDARTDIFALGCILYQMLSGKSPFQRSTPSEAMAAVLRDNPPNLPASIAPLFVMRLIRRCIAKERAERYQSARDLAHDLRSSDAPAVGNRRVMLALAAAAIVVVALLLVAAIVRQRRPAVPAPREIHSILVLPFENANHDPASEYLSDGIAEGLISSLAELPNLRVIGRTTAFHFKGRPFDLPQIRKEVNVDAVLAGRLLSQSNNIVVQADLIDADAGTELWGNRFHEQSADLLSIEQEMVNRISDALRMRLTTAQQNRIATPSTRNPEAYRLYLQGRYFWNKRTPEGVRKAIDFLEQAIAIDPRFALAYAGLADAYTISAVYHYLPAQTARSRSEEAARTALSLDPELAEAHAALGLLDSSRFHWDAAEKQFKEALKINPNYANALHWSSF